MRNPRQSTLQLHLVDGTYELFRAFYGAPPKTSNGVEVGATITFLRSLLGLLRQPDVTHVACAFDHRIESFRNRLLEGYKTGEGIDPRIKSQFPLVEEAARSAGVVVWPMIEFEADDALASAAARWRVDSRVSRILICTPDKDLAQCVGDRVVCFDRRKKEMLDTQGVVDKFGVLPESIPDWLALVGDSADGIPGLRGWGKKSASLLLSRYRHLEEIPRLVEDWDVPVRGAPGLARTLFDCWDEALLYRTLATLRRDVPLTEELEDLSWKGVRKNDFLHLCRRLGVPELEDSVGRWRD